MLHSDPRTPLLEEEKKSTTSSLLEILRLEGIDETISSMLTNREYAALKTTSRDLAGPITPIRYRQRWASTVYNKVAYWGMASEYEAPCKWQTPVREGSFITDSMNNCAACGCTSCCCGPCGDD